MTRPERDGEDLASSPTQPADEEPQSLDDAVRADRDPDSPGAAISQDPAAGPPGEVPEPNEPA